MGYNDLDITTVKGDVVDGPLFKVPGGLSAAIDVDWEPADTPGAVAIGDASTDGTDFERAADDNTIRVWGGKTVRVVYSNFEHTITIRLASSTDSDVLETLVGPENVTTTAGGAKKAAFKDRQPDVDGFIVRGKTLDGRTAMAVIPYGQVDPNLSWTWSDEDITVYEVNIKALSRDTTQGAFYLLVEESGS